MRNQMLGYSFVFAAAMIGCGGDDDGGVTVPDAKVFMDAGIDAAPLCTVMSAAQPLGLGTMQMPSSGNYFFSPTSGPLMGRVIFGLGAGLPGSTPTAADALFIEVVKPMQGNFPTNTPQTFNPDPTATYVAAAYILEDLNRQVMPPTYTRVLYASNGSVTLTAIGETNGSLITGSATATNFREINEMTGADVAGGCTASHAGLSFNLQHMTARTELPSWSEEGGMKFTPEQLEQIATLIQGIKANQAQ